MFVEVCGAGPNVVLLNGTPAPATHLDPLARTLASRYRCLVPHLPGYGNSSFCHGVYELSAVGDELALDLAALGTTRAVFVGFSGGAYRALDLALRAPALVSGVITLSGLAGFEADERSAYRGMARVLREHGAAALEPTVAKVFASDQLPPGKSAQLGKWVYATPAASLARELDAFADAPDLTPKLRDLSCPVLARAGTADRALPYTKSQAIVCAVARGTLQLVPGAGHALLEEDFAATAEAVKAFLAQVKGSEAA